MIYTIQVSNDDAARVAGAECWLTLHDGPLESDYVAKTKAIDLAVSYRYVRVFRGNGVGRLWFIPEQRS